MAKRKRRGPGAPAAEGGSERERAAATEPVVAADEGDDERPPRRRLRPEVRFLITFLVVLAASFAFLAWTPVNDYVVEPFTGQIAKASAVALRGLGQDVTRIGTVLRSPRFAVNIKNGCNGVEAMVILLAAIVAFPAPWKARLLGLAAGAGAIQVVNLVRVVALFLTGAYLPRLFDTSHTVVWQTLVILSAVLIWILWARRVAPRPVAAA
ncbi:MAG TPA: exosortase H [Thermoanaerobaculia bacterium]|jgi:exosortase H (IPTLxxWG-CTERM-specific)|nr:exosortase H [Thermoanaerobaculia bacterium]